ncbi:FAD/NAD(P)-binding domain-containing protein [Lojkania enalia]|uniref:FAD/NAD(P)-binding domain-containing protein n=1 Tax=Lojkania enalia TaxID=147567 RepID=A0A9P4N135_9PLEO|nr:FAD/NAD(P)-binding domain-containing protein [Didymosphaeria enalia]
MNGHANGHAASTFGYDVLVIGAGIAGINAGYRLQTALPDYSYAILEGRHELGGTWSLFKYPGIRSDSDLHTFGFSFNPWLKPNSIATGESIIEYLNETVSKFGIDRHIQYNHKVTSADWSSDQQQWRLEVDYEGHTKIYHAKFVIMGTGYYDYEKPLEAKIPGLDNFQGKAVHTQFWPEDLDYKGKKIVVIGSGATTITLVPALVDGGAAKVTQLQRSPSYVMNSPQKKPGEYAWYERVLPRALALWVTRMKFILIPYLFYLFCRKFPNSARNLLRKEAKSVLPEGFPMDPHFQPSYNPWDQRLCFCPDNDFFKSFESGRAEIITDTIRSVVKDGIELNSGHKVDADIIVTATGLNVQVCGKIAISVDKQPVDVSSQWLWRHTMLTNVPNLGVLIGYINASWTLGADSSCLLLTRLLTYMRNNGYTKTTPSISESEKQNPRPVLGLTSTYLKNAFKALPHAGNSGPWLPRENYFKDYWAATRADLRKGLNFEKVST